MTTSRSTLTHADSGDTPLAMCRRPKTLRGWTQCAGIESLRIVQQLGRWSVASALRRASDLPPRTGRLTQQQLADSERLLNANHQATGMLATQLGVSVEEALSRLRAAASAQAIPLSDFARDIVVGTHTFGPVSL